ncbi:Glutamate transport membrane-spanning protein [Roseibacterium elongatum DSM 19469]|uniref:Glutamate transport membrane-spanning protein n=1 Tax=Roseicyclus elongatus DSM 19469 TaxID=1294273 RepID=W8S1F3_9RHOB|nr:amino acid ABC transporter permease [Roseibacterium elongatum]AHM03977.1 Glutamate transport membrane-spanning protein [Roseibacterium elongatum DSM 19469]
MSDTHAESALATAFVRREMLPEKDPPVAEKGVIKWLRENLFSSVANTILTLVSIYVIYWLLSHVLGWMVNGIWDAGSLSECREIRDARYGEGVEVACWAVLTDRWDQLMFGFYPSELYWRPVLALVLFLGAIAPVLYDGLPRKLLAFTAMSPFVLYWLLWGGTIWGPLAVAVGFVVGWVAFRFLTPIIGNLGGTIAAIVVPILYWFFAAGPLAGALGAIAPIGIEFVPSDDFGGFMLAFVIGIAGIILSLPLGIVLALGRQSDLFIINKFSVIFIEVIRGVPLIVWLFTASLLLNYFLPPGSNFDLMLRVIIMVTLFASAYIAEVVRGGLAALPRGQYEGADSLGLDYWQSMRLIILPQALKISIPGIVSTFIGLFKDTTLVVFIGLLDPIGFSNAIRASTDWNGVYWELFIFIGLCFFIACYSMSRYSQYLERKLRTDHR